MYYKCKHCDTVFEEFHSNCPNCNGTEWLTNNSNDAHINMKEENSVKVDTEEEIVNAEETGSYSLLFPIYICGLFAFMGYLVFLLINSPPMQNLLDMWKTGG